MAINEQLQPTGSVSAEDEIHELERRLQEKKRMLAERGAEPTHEKTVLKEVLKEHIADVRDAVSEPAGAPAPVAGTHVLPSDSTTPHATPSGGRTYTEEEKAEGMRTLVEMALTRSIEEAVQMAQTESPWFIDELHDHLVDEYYDKLLALRKIEKL